MNQVLVAHNIAEKLFDLHVHKILLMLEKIVQFTHETILAQVDLHAAATNLALQDEFACMNDNLNALCVSISEQLVTVS